MHIINNADTGMTHTTPLIQDIPFYPGLTYRPPPKPIRSNMPRSQKSPQSSPSEENINPDSNLDFEKIHHFKKVLFLIFFPQTGQIILSRPKRIKQSHKHG